MTTSTLTQDDWSSHGAVRAPGERAPPRGPYGSHWFLQARPRHLGSFPPAAIHGQAVPAHAQIQGRGCRLYPSMEEMSKDAWPLLRHHRCRLPWGQDLTSRPLGTEHARPGTQTGGSRHPGSASLHTVVLGNPPVILVRFHLLHQSPRTSLWILGPRELMRELLSRSQFPERA